MKIASKANSAISQKKNPLREQGVKGELNLNQRRTKINIRLIISKGETKLINYLYL